MLCDFKETGKTSSKQASPLKVTFTLSAPVTKPEIVTLFSTVAKSLVISPRTFVKTPTDGVNA